MRILLVEDDALLGDGIRAGLRLADYAVDWVRDPDAARLALLDHAYQACVLDLGLPKRDGLLVLKDLRHCGNPLPVLILTARDSSADKIAGLDAGADDYLTKPFDLLELQARLRALIRRASGAPAPTLEHAGVVLDPASKRVTRDGQPVLLSAREYTLLHDLLSHKQHIRTRSQLEESLYAWGEETGSNTVEVYIHHLRKKLGNTIQPATALRHMEKTGSGYRLHFFNHATQSVEVCIARKVIFAAPKFVLPWVYPGLRSDQRAAAKALVYSPWLTVNLLVNHFGENAPAWDNVMFGSKSLGYVVAEHQRAGKLPHARTLTFFHAFDEDDTLQSRRRLLQMTEHEALQMALDDVGRAHPQVNEFVESACIYRWAHAMVRPTPGFLARMRGGLLEKIDENFYGAHSDVSGMSNFEEAQYRGVMAARRVLGEIS